MSGRPVSRMFRVAQQAAILAAAALPAVAQHRHAVHDDMEGMDMPAPAASAAVPKNVAMDGAGLPAAASSSPAMHMSSDAGSMPLATYSAGRGAMPSMHAQPGDATRMGRMLGGPPAGGARSPDYSDGIAASHMPGMDMGTGMSFALLQFDRLEAYAGRNGHGQRWELHGWYGGDADKLLLRTEGERTGGRLAEGDAEALWSHAATAYWDGELGVRHDFGVGPGRDWLAIGVQGLAPYRFELQATAYVGPAGRTAFRLRADYDLLFTQRLILQPELEANLYGRDDRARAIGRGLSDLQLGLRLRYEIRREFAPYAGVQFVHRFGHTADFVRDSGGTATDRQFVLGLRIWF